MWHEVAKENLSNKEFTAKWVKVDHAGRIIGRVQAADGEFSASTLVFDAEGVGKKVFKGWYLNLEAAKAAVDGPAAPVV